MTIWIHFRSSLILFAPLTHSPSPSHFCAPIFPAEREILLGLMCLSVCFVCCERDSSRRRIVITRLFAPQAFAIKRDEETFQLHSSNFASLFSRRWLAILIDYSTYLTASLVLIWRRKTWRWKIAVSQWSLGVRIINNLSLLIHILQPFEPGLSFSTYFSNKFHKSLLMLYGI